MKWTVRPGSECCAMAKTGDRESSRRSAGDFLQTGRDVLDHVARQLRVDRKRKDARSLPGRDGIILRFMSHILVGLDERQRNRVMNLSTDPALFHFGLNNIAVVHLHD